MFCIIVIVVKSLKEKLPLVYTTQRYFALFQGCEHTIEYNTAACFRNMVVPCFVLFSWVTFTRYKCSSIIIIYWFLYSIKISSDEFFFKVVLLRYAVLNTFFMLFVSSCKANGMYVKLIAIQ